LKQSAKKIGTTRKKEIQLPTCFFGRVIHLQTQPMATTTAMVMEIARRVKRRSTIKQGWNTSNTW